MTRNLSPALLARIDRLSGCRGRWIVDCRELEGDYSYALRDLQESCLYSSLLVPVGDDARCWALYRSEVLGLDFSKPTPEDAALYCAHTGWRSRLLFVSDYLREDCTWPGGYSPSAVYRSNARVFRDEFARELEAGADGDGPDVALDLRYVTEEMLESLESLEGYPLLSEDDHSELEMEDQQEAWESWAGSDWRRLVCAQIDGYLPEDCPFDGDDLLSRLACEDDKLRELFEQCRDSANEYWQEESDGGQWIHLHRVAQHLTLEDLRELTGVPLQGPAVVEAQERWADQQRWRAEPYSWPGADPAPLLGGANV